MPVFRLFFCFVLNKYGFSQSVTVISQSLSSVSHSHQTVTFLSLSLSSACHSPQYVTSFSQALFSELQSLQSGTLPPVCHSSQHGTPLYGTLLSCHTPQPTFLLTLELSLVLPSSQSCTLLSVSIYSDQHSLKTVSLLSYKLSSAC